jgi:hypothetical protein
MCESAYELKRIWKQKEGDRVYVKYDLYFEKKNLTPVKNNSQPVIKEGEHYLTEYEVQNFNKLKNFVVWMPHIEQLIDLLLGKYGDLSPLLTDFNRYIFRKNGTGRPIQMYDFNELWFLFYMFQVHSKVWDGEFHKVKTNIWGEIIENT